MVEKCKLKSSFPGIYIVTGNMPQNKATQINTMCKEMEDFIRTYNPKLNIYVGYNTNKQQNLSLAPFRTKLAVGLKLRIKTQRSNF